MAKRKKVAEVSGLTKKFGDFTAVAGLDFEVLQGEIFGFLGPNGSGKTTTIRMLLGLMAPTAGKIQILNIPVNGYTEAIRPKIGYMSQRFSLYNDLSVIENLQFYGRAYGLRGKLLDDRIREALEIAGLRGREQAKTHELSGGWRQRLALGASILHKPQLLFLDEPTAGVDPVSRREFWDLLYRLIEEEITVFVTTHYMDEAEHCHRLAFIQNGKRIAYGSPDEIKADVMRGDVLEISPSNAVKAMKVLRDAQRSGQLMIEEIELFGSLVHVVAKDSKALRKSIRAILKKVSIDAGQMTVVEPSLEDVFIAGMK